MRREAVAYRTAETPDQHHYQADRYARPERAANPASKAAQRMKQRNRVRAEAAVDAGKDARKQSSWLKLAMLKVEEGRAEEARLSDPLEQAKLALRRRGIVVYCEGIYENGRADLYTVGSKRNLTARDVVRMAKRLA